MSTKIEWTDETLNVAVGCKKISEGCLNCAAESWAKRLKAMGHPAYQDVVDEKGWTGKVCFRPELLEQLLRWRNPRRIFIEMMGDLFLAPFEFIDKVFAVAALSPQHILQILTKRADRALEYYLSRTPIDDSNRVDRLPQYYHIITDWLDEGESGYLGKYWELCEKAAEKTDFCRPLKNVHLGVTCENQRCADERIPVLLQIPAAKRFVSLEPLLEEIDLIIAEGDMQCINCQSKWHNDFSPYRCPKCGNDDSYQMVSCNEPYKDIKSNLDQVIIGCESGPRRRPCKLEWIESIIDQCDAAGVPPYVKQLPMPWCKKEYRGQWADIPSIEELDAMIEMRSYVSHDPAEWPEKFRRRELM